MSERLAVLEAQIPILEDKLKAMKRERKSLRLSAANCAKWQDPAYRARNSAAASRRASTPKAKARWAAIHFNGPPLPFGKDTQEFRMYRKLRRYGVDREAAIAEVSAGAP